MSRQRRMTPQPIIRTLADMLMVNVALIIALGLRYVWLVGIQGHTTTAQTIFQEYIQAYLNSFWLLTLISVIVFYASGFYNRGRAYQGRYKALVIIQAVSLSYLIFGFLAFLFPNAISRPPGVLISILPRGAFLLAWGLTLGILIGARLWSTMWRTLVRTEDHLFGAIKPEPETKNILVIGGAGYIGSALLPKLLDKGYNVRLLDLLLFDTEPITDVLNHPNLEIMQADFRQVDKVVEAMRNVDAVIHLGAIVGDPACALDEELTIEVNLMATRMIAEVAKGSGVNRFVFASTCSVYGAGDEILDERSMLNPVSLYAKSKIASELVLTQAADDNFAPVFLRFGTIYGLSGRTRFDLVVNLLTAKATLEGKITVFGGDQWRPFLHVDDAALAVFKALEAPLAVVRNEVFNVGSNEQNYTIQEVGELINQYVPQAELINMGSDSDRRNYRVDFRKIRNKLNFTPQWTVEKGIEQVIGAIQGNQVQNYQDPKYSNVKFLSEEGTSRLVRREQRWAHDLINSAADQIEPTVQNEYYTQADPVS